MSVNPINGITMEHTYIHTVKYYETDKMGITHHSNYVRFMEEARVDFLDKIGYGYQQMERDGFVSPVVSVQLNYKKSTTFADEISITVHIAEISAVRLQISYTMTCRGETVCTAASTHCFVDADGRPISIKRNNPKLFALLSSLAKETN